MKPHRNQTSDEEGDRSGELTTTQYLIKTMKQLQAEVEYLKLELKKSRGIPSRRIGMSFIVLGALPLAFSVLNNSQILAFIGLGLTFWGALFFFVRPVRYVESSLLDSTAISSYSTIDRILKDLKYKGKSYYIPPYPKEVYLPDYLKGLKEMIVFISADSGTNIPSIEEVARSRFILESPKGICVFPPGLGLFAQFEQELRLDIAKLELNEICETLPHLVVENFQLAKEIEMRHEGRQVYLKVSDSIYKSLYGIEKSLKSVHLLGCPVASAIACAIAKTTGKIVSVQRDSVSPDGQTIEVWYSLI